MKTGSEKKSERLTPAKFGAELGVKTPTVRAWCREKRIAHFRAGKLILIPRSELERLLAKSFIPARPELAL